MVLMNIDYAMPLEKGRTSTPSPPAKGLPADVSAIIPKGQVWEDWKGVLHHLYLKKNMPLKHLITEMETRYNFRATERMYKRQFRQKWHWHKYNSGSLQSAISQGVPYQQPDGDKSCIRSMPDPLEPEPELEPFSSPSPSPSATPSLPPPAAGGSLESSPESSGSQEEKDIYERVAPSMRIYLRAYGRHNPTWWAEAPERGRVCTLGGILLLFECASRLFRLDRFVDGGRLFRRAFQRLDEKVDWEDPRALAQLALQLPLAIFEGGHLEVLAIYLRHVLNLVRVKRGHALLEAVVSTALQLMEKRQGRLACFFRVATRAWLDSLCEVLGGLAAPVLSARTMALQAARPCQRQDVLDLLSRFKDVSKEAVKSPNRRPETALVAAADGLCLQAAHQHYADNFESEVRHFVTALRQPGALPDGACQQRFELEATWALGTYHISCGRCDVALQLFEDNFAFTSLEDGRDEIDLMWKLSKFLHAVLLLRGVGREQEAGRVMVSAVWCMKILDGLVSWDEMDVSGCQIDEFTLGPER